MEKVANERGDESLTPGQDHARQLTPRWTARNNETGKGIEQEIGARFLTCALDNTRRVPFQVRVVLALHVQLSFDVRLESPVVIGLF